MAYYGGLESGILTAGKAFSQAILGRQDEARKREELEMRRAEHEVRLREMALREQALQFELSEKRRLAGLQAGLPTDMATLYRIQTEGRPDAPTPEYGMATGEAPPRITSPWASTSQMYGESPEAARAALNIREATGGYGAFHERGLGMDSVEKAEEAKRLTEYRATLRRASPLVISADPTEREAGVNMITRAMLESGEVTGKALVDVAAAAETRAADSAFKQEPAVGAFLEAVVVQGQAPSPEALLRFFQAASRHPTSAAAQEALKEVETKYALRGSVTNFLVRFVDALGTNGNNQEAAAYAAIAADPAGFQRLLALVENKPDLVRLIPGAVRQVMGIGQQGGRPTPAESAATAFAVETARGEARNTIDRQLEKIDAEELEILKVLGSTLNVEIEPELQARLQRLRDRRAALLRRQAGAAGGQPGAAEEPAPTAERDVEAIEDAAMAQAISEVAPGLGFDELRPDQQQAVYERFADLLARALAGAP